MTVIDFKGWSLRNAVPMRTSRATLHVLQSHYPERLHTILALNVPALFAVFWNAIRPFVDPVTREKIVFVTGSEEQPRRTSEKPCHWEAAPSHWKRRAGGATAVPQLSKLTSLACLGQPPRRRSWQIKAARSVVNRQ